MRLGFWRVFALTGLMVLPATAWAAPGTSDADGSPTPVLDVSSSASSTSLTPGQEGTYERAVVESVTDRNERTPGAGQQVQVFRVRFLSGPEQGTSVEIHDETDSNPYHLRPRTGDKIVVFVQDAGDATRNYYIEGFDRQAVVLWLVALFVLTLVLLSGWQGVKVSFSIALSIFLIGYVLIPLFLRGVPAVPVAIVLTGVFTMLSAGLTTGWNRKSVVTAIGTMGGALVAYAISLLFGTWAHLDGLATDEDRLFFDKNPGLNPRGLLFAGIIIASAGVVEDVAVSIASGVSEVRKHNPRAGFRELFTSGMVVGNDHMGALANTLIYAYVGASLSTLLLFKQFGGSWLKFINFDSVVDEVVRSLAGTIGLAFTVPITALLAAWLAAGEKFFKEPMPGRIDRDTDV